MNRFYIEHKISYLLADKELLMVGRDALSTTANAGKGNIVDGSFRIGDWRVQPQLNTLTDATREVQIEPKAMALLVYLAGHAGEVVSKEQLLGDVWEGAFVTDEVLTYAVWELRKALGDDAKKPRFIQTIPKKGYRLIVPVTIEDGLESVFAYRPEVLLWEEL